MLDYKLVQSKRKTVSIEVLGDGSILVRAPLFCSKRDVDSVVEKHESAILKHRQKMQNSAPIPRVTKAQVEQMKKDAAVRILPRVQQMSKITGLSYEGAKITVAKHRFGSCSGKNHLCFSAFLMLVSDVELDYVILHELCHTIEHNHSRRFYALVEHYMPDWKIRHNRLKKIVIPQIVE